MHLQVLLCLTITTLKCHWDQNVGIPYFCIFENSRWLLVTMPNFNSLRRLEVAFFGRFLSRFYGRHYWPLFRKLACELAEVTLEAHLRPNTFIRLLAARNLTVVEGRFPANCLLYGLEIFVAAAVIKGITCVVQCHNNKSRVFPEGCSCRRIPEVDYSIVHFKYMEKKIRKKRDERYLIFTQLK